MYGNFKYLDPPLNDVVCNPDSFKDKIFQRGPSISGP